MSPTPRVPELSRRAFVIGGLAVAGGLVVVSCSSGDSSSSGTQGGSPRTLRYQAESTAPETLDPAKAPFWNPLVYDVLIHRGPDGKFGPQLATSWQYIGTGNTTFEMKLRKDVTFSDGTPLNSAAVKANIEYRRNPATSSQSARYVRDISSVELVDDLTVRVRLSKPNPLLPNLFAQGQGGPGILISPKALADPAALSTGTFGIGRYLLDPQGTVTGDHYAFRPNPDYWNKDDGTWDRVVIHYLPQDSASLSALETGQLDAAKATYSMIDAGKKAGFQATGPGRPIVLGLSLFDRGGAVVPALGDVRVRKALNHAVDRKKIATALIGTSGAPTDQLAAPGSPAWTEGGFYPYDVDRAKQLLSEAGYAGGFSLPVRIPQQEQHVRITQAIADDLGKVGVKLVINAVPSDEFDQADGKTNRKYGAVYLGWGIDDPVRLAPSFWLKDATNNAFGSSDETLTGLQQKSLTADEKTRAGLSRETIARVADLGWFLPVLIQGESILYNPKVVKTTWVDFQSVPDVGELRPV